MPQNGLGFGLGLNKKQQKGLSGAIAGGTGQDWMASHQKVNQRAQNQAKQGTGGSQRLAAAMTPAAGGAPPAGSPTASGGKSAKAPAAPPAGAPAAGAGGAKGGGIQGGQAGGSPTPGGGGSTFNDVFNKQFGGGAANQFGPSNWNSQDPIAAAEAKAKRALGGTQAEIRNRYAQSGFGSSGREAIAQGQAAGDFATNFGDVAAQRGMEDKNAGLNRMAEMFQGAGAQQLQEKLGMGQLNLQENQQRMNLGTGLTGVGAQEQGIPNMEALMGFIGNMSQQPSFQEGSSRQPRK